MKRFLVSGLMAALAFIVLPTVASADQESLRRAAWRLERSAENFHAAIERETGYSHLTAQSQLLVQSAKHFRRGVEHHRDRHELWSRYRTVRERFDTLAGAYRHAYRVRGNVTIHNRWRWVRHSVESLREQLRGSRYTELEMGSGN